jgi:GTP cyclohydrolase IA
MVVAQRQSKTHNRVDSSLAKTLQSASFRQKFELGYPPIDRERIEAAIAIVLESVGENVQREGLIDTPKRVAKAYEELLEGYRIDPVSLINNALFDVENNDMVVVCNIEFASLCEHHMLPFLGRVHVAYLPQGKVLGLSKIPRIVDLFARRLQLQERLTHQIARFIDEVIHPEGVAVVVEGQHMCSLMRGVKKQHSHMTSHTMIGAFRENAELRREFLMHISRKTHSL